jgi:antitoxin component of MazEF toxin-antitoxin module
LPKAAAIKAGVVEGSSVDVEATEGKIVVRALHRYRLADLLARVNATNLHAEVSSGRAVGREAW